MATIVRINILGLLVLSFLEVAVPFNLDSQYPIVFEDPTVHPTRETYFGYSVLLYGSLNTKSWIMVGAPRANSTYERHLNVNEPGVVYRCPFWPPQKCEPLLLDKTGNDKYKYRRMFFWDLKDGAWIGAAMDVQPGPNGRVVVCGPRWTNQYYIYEREEFFILGVCYWFEAEDDVIDGKAVKLLPLLNDDRVVKVRRVNTIFDFGVGQCGISAHMPLKKGNEVGYTQMWVFLCSGEYDCQVSMNSFTCQPAPPRGTVLYEDKDALPSGGFNKRSVASPGDFANLYVPPSNPSPNNKLASFDYFGYQVSSGYFFDENELWYATSAPRAANILGKVIFYKKSLDNIHRHIMVDTNHHVMGIQCGEYFGASIAAGDINNDDYEDLIVGAPLYTIEGIPRADMDFGYEEGRISIFFGSKTKKMKEVQIMGKARGARFGSAVSYLGDLDSDGFGEIAVGAPYENDGCGVVYIYSGSVNGIITKPVQQLFAHDTYPLLRGFGISISPHPADIDRNGCTDVAVGAYKSGHVVVYRGRPVLRWKTKTPYSTPRLPRNATHINLFGACITYLGNYVPNNLTIWRTLDMDPVYKRCHINNHHVLKEALPLSRGIEHCENIIINLKDSKTKNIIEPVKIRIRYQLEEEVLLEKLGNNRTREEFQTHPILVKADRIHGRDGFCQTCPIAKESPDITISIPFEVGCGLDEICLADLEITGELPQLREESEQPTFVIGSNKTLKFNVHITNKGESAYLTRVYIELGSPAKIARIPPECHEISHLPFMETTSDTKGDSATLNGTVSQQNDKSHGNHSDDKVLGETGTDNKMNISSIYTRCDLDNPLPTNSTREQVVEIDMKNVYHSQGMHIFAYVTTVSNESTPENNYWARYIPFIYNADMEIIGSAGKNDLFTYFKENQNESESRIKFYHIYQVKKYGYSPVEKINIIFKIPRFIDQVNFLRILATEGSQSGQSFPCSVLDEGDTEQNQADDDLNSVNTDYNSREMTLKLNHSSTQVPSNRTLYLNCSSLTKKDEHSVGCMSVSCAAGPFVNSLTVAKVLLEMELDVGSLEKLMGLRDIILLETQGIVEVVEPTGLIQPTIDKPDISWASTYFIGDIPKKHVESWVLALAIAGGFMLLLFVAMAMHKAGFFERKKKEELKSLKRKTLAEYTTNDNGEQEQEIEQASIE